MRIHAPRLTIGQQIAAMQAHFPDFAYHRENQMPTWVGTLQPTVTSPQYVVKVRYREPKSPRVWVLSPKLQPDAPHRYPSDGSLCLYYPPDESWTPRKFVAKTTVPWTALWLAFYELWLSTGQWYGLEAPHSKAKAG